MKPTGFTGWRTRVGMLVAVLGMMTASRVDAQVTAYAYVPLPNTQQLVVIDTRAQAVVGAPIPIGTSAFSAVPTPDGRRVYVAGFGANVVKVFDAITNTFIGVPIAVGNNPYGIGLTADGRTLYMPNSGSSTMTVIDTATDSVITTVGTGGVSPATPTVSPDGQRLYVPNFGSNSLAVFDTSTHAQIAGSPFALPGCVSPLYATFTLDGLHAYVSCYTTNNLKVIDTTTLTTVGNVAGLNGARDSVLTRDGTTLLVGNLQTGTDMYVVDVATNTATPLTLTNSPTSLALTPDGTIAYITESTANKVTLLDVATRTVVGSIPLPSSPEAHSRFMGPNIVTTACPGCGPLAIGSDADLVPLGFDRFVNFNTGIIALTGDWTTTRTLSLLAGGGSIVTGGFNATIAAPVINEGILTKFGTGTLTLAGPSTHAGGTTVLQGTLVVNAAHDAAVRLQAGTLAGNGTIGSIDATGGSINPGTGSPGTGSPAILHATAATLTPAVTFAPDINGTVAGTGYDQLDAGSLALGGATLAVHVGFVPPPGAAFTIATHTTGTFAGLPEGARFSSGNVHLRITYQGGTGSDVVLTLDTPPSVTGLADQTIDAGTTLGPIAFTVADDLTPAAALTVTATSSNQALLPDADIILGGSGAARMLTATPVPGASGTTVITVTVSDGGQVGQQTFTLTVLPLAVYYLAEGATGGFFSTDLLIANPNASAAPVVITFFKDDGTTVVQNRTLLATSATTFHVGEIPGLESAAFSTSVASTSHVPLVVERTMWWDARGYGAHTEKASAGAATTWQFAEGSQGYFHTYFLLLNPHAVDTVAHLTYLLEGGGTIQRDYTVRATSRRTIDVQTESALVNQSFGAVVTFDLPGMAERAMYFGDSPLYSGGHAAAGVTAPATSWFLAEGATGTFFDTFVLIANPNSTAANLTVTYLPEGGTPIVKTYPLPGQQRLTLNIADQDPALASVAVSTRVDSDQAVVVERSQYWPHGGWYEAHNSAGETSPGTSWGLAEGRVGGTNNAQTYILVANPGGTAATLTATFLRENGTTIVKTFTVPPTSRFTIAINGPMSHVPELANESFGTTLTSTQPVIVERAMYADAEGVIWAAGTAATATRLP
jgi:autotransporter-associated beta strand protein/YVTN family beta-propeller protein